MKCGGGVRGRPGGGGGGYHGYLPIGHEFGKLGMTVARQEFDGIGRHDRIPKGTRGLR